MKATRLLITASAVFALLLSLASCAGKPKMTQTVTAGNIQVTIRDDMKEDPSITSKGDSYITCYFWNGYGMNIGSVGSSETKFSGKSTGDLLMETLNGQKNLSELKQYGDIPYAEYTLTDSGKDYLFTNFIFEEGYEYYFLEFYTMSKSSAKYMDQYKQILDSVKMVNEPEATKAITIKGVNLTVDGDIIDEGDNIFLCSRYMVSGFSYDVKGYNLDAETFCRSTIAQGSYKNDKGEDITEVNTDANGISSFECYMNDMYTYHYAKIEGDTLIYLFFFNTKPADEQLKADYSAIVAAATAASAA